MAQYTFDNKLGVAMQQAITSAKADPNLCRQMSSLGHNTLSLDNKRQLASNDPR